MALTGTLDADMNLILSKNAVEREIALLSLWTCISHVVSSTLSQSTAA